MSCNEHTQTPCLPFWRSLFPIFCVCMKSNYFVDDDLWTVVPIRYRKRLTKKIYEGKIKGQHTHTQMIDIGEHENIQIYTFHTRDDRMEEDEDTGLIRLNPPKKKEIIGVSRIYVCTISNRVTHVYKSIIQLKREKPIEKKQRIQADEPKEPIREVKKVS